MGEGGFANPRHILYQKMTPRENAGNRETNRHLFTENDPTYLGYDGIQQLLGGVLFSGGEFGQPQWAHDD